jgi:hypothetical protein
MLVLSKSRRRKATVLGLAVVGPSSSMYAVALLMWTTSSGFSNIGVEGAFSGLRLCGTCDVRPSRSRRYRSGCSLRGVVHFGSVERMIRVDAFYGASWSSSGLRRDGLFQLSAAPRVAVLVLLVFVRLVAAVAGSARRSRMMDSAHQCRTDDTSSSSPLVRPSRMRTRSFAYGHVLAHGESPFSCPLERAALHEGHAVRQRAPACCFRSLWDLRRRHCASRTGSADHARHEQHQDAAESMIDNFLISVVFVCSRLSVCPWLAAASLRGRRRASHALFKRKRKLLWRFLPF